MTSNQDQRARLRRIVAACLPRALVDYQPDWLVDDIVAGLTLAAVAIPVGMGVATIAGEPVVAGIYTVLLPLVAFAWVGASRRLSVGADSATAAILFSGLVTVAEPVSTRWMDLAIEATFLTGVLLLLARLARLSFLADFLSQTVLTGFLGGVGVGLVVGQLPNALGFSALNRDFIPLFAEVAGHLASIHRPTLAVSLGVLILLFLTERYAPRVPGMLLAVALAIAASMVFDLGHRGIGLVGAIRPGLPAVTLPPLTRADGEFLFPLALSMALVILAQSTATGRRFAQRHDETIDESRDLAGLALANIAAAFTTAFVVNGSPTKTAVVDAAGGRTQLASVVAAIATLIVLELGTGLIARLPVAVLAALVIYSGVRLIDVRSLRNIYNTHRLTFAVAAATLLAVIVVGVERGIIIAISLSILDHLRQEYRPVDTLLVRDGATWRAERAAPGMESADGLLIYRFNAPLFFANSGYFSQRLQAMVAQAPHAVRWLVIDLVSVSNIDYTAGLVLQARLTWLARHHIQVALAQGPDVVEDLFRRGILAKDGRVRAYPTIQEAVSALRQVGDVPSELT